MLKRILLIIFLFGFNNFLKSQDVLQLMQYNLLNYGNFTSYCTSSNNNVLLKNEYFKTIFKHVKPDILTINEMAESTIYHESLLTNTLNVDGETDYKRATLTSTSQGNYLVNMLYYNSRKLTLYKHEAISTTIRATDVYMMYYNAADLSLTKDTTFLTCIVTHLKAGSTSADATTRATMTSTIVNYIQTRNLRNNYLFMGDFNIYTSTETAYTNLIKSYNGTYYLYDPIDTPGAWNNNYNFRFVHTQSTRTIDNGCASSGGLDDRLDFILSSAALMNGTNGMQILPSTYRALGNDGLHYNTSIIATPTNTSAPTDVVNALYNASDHLPVLVQIKTDQSYLGIEEAESFAQIKFQNPVHKQMQISILFEQDIAFELQIFDLLGRIQMQLHQSNKSSNHQVTIDLSDLKSGIYFLRIKTENGKQSVHKFLKN